MKLSTYWFLFLVFALFSGCSSNSPDQKFDVFASNFDFSTSPYDWKGDFADYPVKDSSKLGLKFEYDGLPVAAAGSGEKYLTLTGNNTNSGLFLFIKKKVSDLKPNTEYTLVFEVQLVFDLDSGHVDDVYLKVGATTQEPKKIVQGDFYRVDIDKGSNNNSGSDMVVIGKVSSSLSYEVQDYSINQNTPGYNTNPALRVKTNNSGELWLIIGIDSILKGKQTIYYKSANVVYSVSN